MIVVRRRLALVAFALATINLGPNGECGQQLPLNAKTIAIAHDLQMTLRNPMTSVIASEQALRGLARIPDPQSLNLFRTILLTPKSYSGPVRRIAALMLVNFRGASNEMTARLLREALEHESVREVVSAIDQAMRAKTASLPRYLAHSMTRVNILE